MIASPSNRPARDGSVSTEMTFQRITRCAEVVRHWSFFSVAFVFISDYLHYPYSLDVYRRILLKLTKTPSSFVGMVFDNRGEPVCFGAAYDCTPIFATEREYDIPFLYHRPTHITATAVLRREFERFCRQQRVRRYSMTTTAFSRPTQDCFSRYGLYRSHMVYKRELKP